MDIDGNKLSQEFYKQIKIDVDKIKKKGYEHLILL